MIDSRIINVTAGLDGYRVWFNEQLYRDFSTLTDASRCASALMALVELDAMPGEAI